MADKPDKPTFGVPGDRARELSRVKRVISMDGNGAVEDCFHQNMGDGMRTFGRLPHDIAVHVCQNCGRAWLNEGRDGWFEVERPTLGGFLREKKFRRVRVVPAPVDTLEGSHERGEP